MTNRLKAPFPWFGSKARVARMVWDRFGNVPTYIEPFAGSLAVLLARPHSPGIEIINDRDCYVANFWRAVKYNPATTAAWADWPMNEVDLHARHRWLVNQSEFRERMMTDPEYYDCKIAGWWAWGLCQWIGSGWCAHLWKQRPALGVSSGIFSDSGRLSRGEYISHWFSLLSLRLSNVRVACGQWNRVLGDAITNEKLTGVFLDPPYSAEADRDEVYATEDFRVAHEAREWAIANGKNPLFRIALCGYDGEHQMPDDWECIEWRATGGYGIASNGRGRKNAARERIWFSPHCLRPGLFPDL